MIFAANPPAPAEAGTNPLFRLGGDLSVNRLGFGAMRSPARAFGAGRLIVITPAKFCDVPLSSASTSSTRLMPMDQRPASC
jgi:hypothetical protein